MSNTHCIGQQLPGSKETAENKTQLTDVCVPAAHTTSGTQAAAVHHAAEKG